MTCETCNKALANTKRFCSHPCRDKAVSNLDSRRGKYIAYWSKRVTPERLQEKLLNEFGYI